MYVPDLIVFQVVGSRDAVLDVLKKYFNAEEFAVAERAFSENNEYSRTWNNGIDLCWIDIFSEQSLVGNKLIAQEANHVTV
jgi:hypothetical protein